MSSQREIRLNAFDMNCVGHQSPGLWAHPRDRSWQYKDLEYWVDLARLLERGKFDGLFIADVLGIYDVLNGSGDAAGSLRVGGQDHQRLAAGARQGRQAGAVGSARQGAEGKTGSGAGQFGNHG